jgi:hypothetical protein
VDQRGHVAWRPPAKLLLRSVTHLYDIGVSRVSELKHTVQSVRRDGNFNCPTLFIDGPERVANYAYINQS